MIRKSKQIDGTSQPKRVSPITWTNALHCCLSPRLGVGPQGDDYTGFVSAYAGENLHLVVHWWFCAGANRARAEHLAKKRIDRGYNMLPTHSQATSALDSLQRISESREKIEQQRPQGSREASHQKATSSPITALLTTHGQKSTQCVQSPPKSPSARRR